MDTLNNNAGWCMMKIKSSSLLAGLYIENIRLMFNKKKATYHTLAWPTLQDGSTHLSMGRAVDHKHQTLHLQGNIDLLEPQDHHWWHHSIVEHQWQSLPIQWGHSKIEEKISMQKGSSGIWSLFNFGKCHKVMQGLQNWYGSHWWLPGHLWNKARILDSVVSPRGWDHLHLEVSHGWYRRVVRRKC